MSYYDEQPQASDPLSNPRVVTAIVLAIAGLIAIVGCVGLYFFIGGRSAGQPTLVVAVTSLPTNTPSLTPVPSETPEPTTTPGPNDISTTLASPTTEGFGGGGGPRYATLSEIRGLVEYKNNTVGDWKAATSEVSVPAGTSIRTSESSSVKLTLNEGTVIRVSSQTQFTLSQLTGDEADPTTTLTLDFGKIWNVVANTPGTTNYEVITPYGKASVRGGAFMSTEHNSTEELDIITCLESVKGCSYSVDGVGVQGLSTGQMLIYKQGDSLASSEKMDQGQLNDWAPTKVPEVITLTPTATSTGTITPSRTPTITRTPANTPNVEATGNSGGTRTAIAATSTALAGANSGTQTAVAGSNSGTQTQSAANQTATQNAGNLTATVYFFNVTATALFQSTANSFTATSFAFTATSFQATSNVIGTSNANTATASYSTSVAATATATFAVAASQTAAASATSGAATVTQAAIPVFSFNPLATNVPESAGQVTLTVNVSVPNNGANMTVDYTLGGGTARGGNPLSNTCTGSGVNSPVDYDNTGGTVTFTPGSTSQTIVVPIADDGCNAFDASTENFQVTLSNPVNPTGPELLGNSISTVTIVNVSPPSVGFSSGTYNAAENVGNFTVTVNLGRAYANTNTVNVNYALSTGSTATGAAACGGTIDYDSDTVTGSLSFAPTEITKTFNVTICDDTTFEDPESINLALSVTSGNATNGTMTTSITIADNDPPPNLTYTVSSAGGSSPTEPGGLGTTFNMVVDFNLSAASGKNVTFNFATAPNTASEGLDYVGRSGLITILAGATTANTQITLKGDLLNELNETFLVNFSNITNATMTSANPLVVTIVDDGDTAPAATYSSVPYEIDEGNSGTKNVQITVNLNRPSGQNIVLGFSTIDGGSCGANTTTAGIDYSTTSGQLTFAPGQISSSYGITVIGDTTVEPDECMTLTLTLITGQLSGTPGTSELWIKNDD